MTDQTIPADKVRGIINEMNLSMNEPAEGSFSEGYDDATGNWKRHLESLLPTPPRPTLADMEDEERAACRWMQADVYNFDRRMVVTEVRTTSADLIEKDGTRWNVDHERVTPRPDLPRMEWPGDQEPAPSLPGRWRFAEHPGHGRVIVTRPTPDTEGHVHFVLPTTGTLGNDWHSCSPDELTYLDQEDDTADTVPPNILAVGIMWDDEDALARACKESGRDQIVVLDNSGGAYVWDEKAEWWEGSASPQYSPFKILHTGQEAAQ